MKHDEILQAAKEATNNQPIYGRKEFTFSAEELQRFAAIVEKRTIERCAHIAEHGPEQCEWTDEADYDTGLWHGYLSAAAAIRKLGEQ